MKDFKNILVIVTLFTIGSTNTRQVGTPQKAVAPKRVSPIVAPVAAPKPIATPAVKLDTSSCISASVLPVFTKNNKKYVILTREARGYPQAEGGKKFTYDDFSGQCEKEDNYEPLLSAAREFYEEGNLQRSLKWSLKDTIKVIKDNTSQIIVYEKDIDKNIPGRIKIKNFTYIINFDKYADALLNNFYTSLNKEKEYYKKLGKNPNRQVTTEKDKIATVLWDDLQGAISYQRIISAAEPIKVQAMVGDVKTKTFRKEQIILRQFLAIKLRPFFLNQPYVTSGDSRMRYYQ